MARIASLTLSALIGLAPLLSPQLAEAAPSLSELERLAVVDIQRCIMETAEGQRAKKKLEKALTRSQARLEKKAQALRKQFEDLQAKAAMLSQSELGRRQQELMRQQAELEQLYQESQAELMQQEALLTEQIYNKVADIVSQLALEDKVQIVLVRSEMTVLYANPKLDITNRVIVAYDKKHP